MHIVPRECWDCKAAEVSGAPSYELRGGLHVVLLQNSHYKLSSLKQHTRIVFRLLKSRPSLAVFSAWRFHRQQSRYLPGLWSNQRLNWGELPWAVTVSLRLQNWGFGFLPAAALNSQRPLAVPRHMGFSNMCAYCMEACFFKASRGILSSMYTSQTEFCRVLSSWEWPPITLAVFSQKQDAGPTHSLGEGTVRRWEYHEVKLTEGRGSP